MDYPFLFVCDCKQFVFCGYQHIRFSNYTASIWIVRNCSCGIGECVYTEETVVIFIVANQVIWCPMGCLASSYVQCCIYSNSEVWNAAVDYPRITRGFNDLFFQFGGTGRSSDREDDEGEEENFDLSAEHVA